MRFPTFILPLAFITACASGSAASAGGCDAFENCQSKEGVAVLAAPDIAQPILITAQQGAVNFERYFGQQPAPIAIVPGGEITLDLQTELKAAGYDLSLPWISAADKQALAQSSIRKQVMEQTQDMPAAQQEAIIKMALAKSGAAANETGTMNVIEKGALAHELGHLWFISAFTPEGEESGGGHGYGGWAPDWLDETAAILLENDALTESRRHAFKTMRAEDFYPLEDFLTMEHPALKSAQALKEKFGSNDSKGGSRAIVLSGKDAEDFLKSSGDSDPTNFYTQARGFADYIIAATGDERAFAKLAERLSAGGTLENWLAETEGLADNLVGLSEDWNGWVKTR